MTRGALLPVLALATASLSLSCTGGDDGRGDRSTATGCLTRLPTTGRAERQVFVDFDAMRTTFLTTSGELDRLDDGLVPDEWVDAGRALIARTGKLPRTISVAGATLDGPTAYATSDVSCVIWQNQYEIAVLRGGATVDDVVAPPGFRAELTDERGPPGGVLLSDDPSASVIVVDADELLDGLAAILSELDGLDVISGEVWVFDTAAGTTGASVATIRVDGDGSVFEVRWLRPDLDEDQLRRLATRAAQRSVVADLVGVEPSIVVGRGAVALSLPLPAGTDIASIFRSGDALATDARDQP
jgi:hypothetical protein